MGQDKKKENNYLANVLSSCQMEFQEVAFFLDLLSLFLPLIFQNHLLSSLSMPGRLPVLQAPGSASLIPPGYSSPSGL